MASLHKTFARALLSLSSSCETGTVSWTFGSTARHGDCCFLLPRRRGHAQRSSPSLDMVTVDTWSNEVAARFPMAPRSLSCHGASRWPAGRCNTNTHVVHQRFSLQSQLQTLSGKVPKCPKF